MTLSKNRTYGPKEILALDGRVPVKMGKGRMSLAGKERIAELLAEGYTITGYSVSSTPAKSTTSTKPVVNRVVSNVNQVLDFTIFWPMDSYKAVGTNGKEWGMANACNTCMVSLVQCQCGHPTIFGDIAVKIVPR